MSFKILAKNFVLPPLYPKVERKLPTVKSKGWTKVDGFTLREKVDFMPQQGLQEKLCSCECNLIFICGAATSGKMAPYDSKILTPSGFVPLGSISVGDIVTGANGQPQRVLQIFEQGVKDVYKVTFDDGSTTECGLEHLWSVAFKKPHYKYSDYAPHTLKEIIERIENGERASIPMCDAIEFTPKAALPIDPYILGVMLGDGHIRKYHCFLSTEDEEILEYFKKHGFGATKVSDKYDYRIRGGLARKLRELGLSGKLSNNKFIPEIYKYADIEARKALVRGLMDTDGTVDKLGHMSFYTVSKRLGEDFQWLIRSLGGRCSISLKYPKYVYKGEKRDGQLCYVLNFTTEHNSQLCMLQRKRVRTFDGIRHGRVPLRRTLKSYEYIGRKQCRCIYVSNPDHLYVADDFIVTHNTYAMYLTSLYGMDKPGFTAILFSYREKDSKKGSSIYRDGIEVLGNFNSCEYSSSDNIAFRFPKYNSQLQLANFNYNIENASEWSDYKEDMKKKQASLIMVDEMTKMLERAMLYLFSRNRDSSGMIPQFIGSFNPEYEHFTREVIQDAGYLDETWHVRKEMEGVVKYFYMKGNSFKDAVWGDTPEEVVKAAGITISERDRAAGLTEADMCKTFTVFTGEAADNRILVSATKGQSVSNLEASGEGEVLKGAYFGPRDSGINNVSKQMIRQLWENPINDDENMYASMDIASGKEDSAPMIIWHGLQMVDIDYFHGEADSLASWIQSRLTRYNVPITNFVYDSTGHGYWVQALTNGVGVMSNKRAVQEYDSNGNPTDTHLQFYNLRSQLLGKLEVMLKRGEISCSIPKNRLVPFGKKGELRSFYDVLSDGVDLFSVSEKNGKTYYNTKEYFKSRYKYSPGELDSMILRMRLELDTRARKQPSVQVAPDAYDELFTPKPIASWGSRW